MEINVPKRKDLKTDRAKARVGEKHGLLTAQEWLGSNKDRRAVYRFSCECGGSCIKTMALVQTVGEHSTCGCANRKSPGPLKHGQSRRGAIAKEYMVWKSMRARCSPRCTKNAYPFYYGKGIRVCERWSLFENFIKDMGPRPGDGYDIDRIDSDGDYEPANCQWLLRSENNAKARTEQAARFRASVFSPKRVRTIRWLVADGNSLAQVSRQEKASFATIKRILAGEVHQ